MANKSIKLHEKADSDILLGECWKYGNKTALYKALLKMS